VENEVHLRPGFGPPKVHLTETVESHVQLHTAGVLDYGTGIRAFGRSLKALDEVVSEAHILKKNFWVFRQLFLLVFEVGSKLTAY